MSYDPQTNFQITEDHRLVYNLRPTGRYRNGNDEWTNDIAITIEARHLPADVQADIANTIRDAMNARYLEIQTSRNKTPNIWKLKSKQKIQRRPIRQGMSI